MSKEESMQSRSVNRHFWTSRPIAALALFTAGAFVGTAACSGESSIPTAQKDAETPPVVSFPRDASVDAAKEPTPAPIVPRDSKAVVTVLETTDTHTNVRSYDYYKLVADESLGLERTATLVKQARTETSATVLVDNGDTIQGTVLADFQATVQPIPCAQTLAVYKAMNAMGYDVGGIGNHEFNYGLAFLSQVTHTPFDVDGVDAGSVSSCGGPKFPIVLSNVFSAKTQKSLFPPSTIVKKTLTARGPDGKTIETTVNVGFLAFTPPQILTWDKRWLDGKVTTKGVNEVAATVVADLRAKGADLVVAIIHGGLDNSPYAPTLENQGYYLAQVPGVDAMLMGHSHQVFPNAASTLPQFGLPGVDKDLGAVSGIPAMMSSFWGQHLGVMQLELSYTGTGWSVDKAKTIVEVRPTSTTCSGGKANACPTGKWRTGAVCPHADLCAGKPDKTKVFVEAEASIAPLVSAEHDATIAYVKTPIGTSDFDLTSFFADVGEVSAIQVVNQAQTEYVTSYVRDNLPQYASLPVLSVSAPFKSGFSGGNDYTAVAAGGVAINNAADLYLYANTIYAVKITGATLVDWLETSATRFRQIDPSLSVDQPLINSAVPGYNFDVVTSPDLTYEIDVTQPLPAMGQKANGRIKNVLFKGQPLDREAEIIVATNNYRASGGGNFPGLDGSKTIYASPDASRDVLIAYIKKKGTLTRVENGLARSFRFTRVPTLGRVVFVSAQNALPKALAAGLRVSLVQQDDGSGKQLSLYSIDLSQ